MKRIKKYSFITVICLMWGCNTEKNSSTGIPAQSVAFNGREIDLTPYVEGFPYANFNPFYAAGKLFYMEKGDKMLLRELSLSGHPDLNRGEIISNIDFATRNVWNINYNKTDGKLYWTGDENNDEIINLTRLDPTTGEVEKLTDVPYIFGYRWDETQERIAYTVRLGDKENRLGELRLYDLTTGREWTIAEDIPEMRFTWGTPSWRPGGQGVVTTAL